MEGKCIQDNVEFVPSYLFFKFQTKDRLEELQKYGHIYMKKLQYFVDVEKSELKKGKGDKFEGRKFRATSMKMIDPKTDNIILIAKDADVVDKDVLQNPVFCISAFNIFSKVIKYKYPKIESEISFDDRMTKDFSDGEEAYALVIFDINKFLKRLENKLDELNLTYKYDLVKYRDTRYIYRDKDTINFNTAFNKDKYFDYQNEFRVIIDKKVDDHFDFDIGNIEDISKLLPAKSISSGLIMKCEAKDIKTIDD